MYDVLFDGMKVGNIQDVVFNHEIEKQEPISFLKTGGTISLEKIECKLRPMTGGMRAWCKMLRWDNKVYL